MTENNVYPEQKTPLPSVWGLIPSRKNSKRLPGKALSLIEGNPLAYYTFEAIKNSGLFNSRYFPENKAFLFTDDSSLLDYHHEYKTKSSRHEERIHIPSFHRPESLSLDGTSTEDTLRYFLKQFDTSEHPDYILILQPTSPLRTADDIDQCWSLFHQSKSYDSLISVHTPSKPMHWAYECSSSNTLSKTNELSSKQLVLPNGALYLCKTSDLLSDKPLPYGRVGAYHMPWHRSVDVDTHEDLVMAEAFIRLEKERNTVLPQGIPVNQNTSAVITPYPVA